MPVPACCDLTFLVLQGAEVTCTAGGRGHIYIGDSAGCVHGLNRQLKVTSFDAHSQPVRCITAFDHASIVITIAVSTVLLFIPHCSFIKG